MQKQLITDILIEEYQKELEIMEANFHHWKFEHPNETRKTMFLHRDINSHKLIIKRLQSLRQQEVQNVIDAADFEEGECGIDYFNQTFEQKGGEKK